MLGISRFKSKLTKSTAVLLGIIFCLQFIQVLPVDTLAAGNEVKAGMVSAAAKGSNPHFAIDNNMSSYWAAPLPNSMEDSIRHIDIKLDALYDLTRLKIFNPPGAYYQYQVYASSDGENFTKIAYKNDRNVCAPGGDVYQVEGANGTKGVGYLRINLSFASNQSNGASKIAGRLSEAEVYGVKIANSSVPDKPTLTIPDFEETVWADEYALFERDPVYADGKTIQEMTNLVGRVLGNEWKDDFTFVIAPVATNGKDAFQISTAGGKVAVKGANGVSLASGFNYYLKNYCNVNYNPIFAGGGTMPDVLPAISGTVTKQTNYDERYALNFCTYSYTMAFWGWEEFEAYIDWAAMNGVNLMLDIVGQEEVIRRVFMQYNYTDAEVRDFISGPAYFAWFYMQNMYNFGGPLPNNWFTQRVELGRQMHDRMQTLGIKPVLMGYSGQVPVNFTAKNPGASVISQGGWVSFNRPYMLHTLATGAAGYFPRMAADFYEAQEAVFGDVTDYYAVDPFHEGGNMGGMDATAVYKKIQDEMLKADPQAVWIIQQWSGSITTAKLNNLNKDHALVLDLFSDTSSQSGPMETTQTKWIWNMLHGFGGRMGLFGDMETVATKPATDYAAKNHMVGIGTTMEGYANSAIMYDLISDMTWSSTPINTQDYIVGYVKSRYGKQNADAIAGWNILKDTAYAQKTSYVQGPPESVINARPTLNYSSASTWGHTRYEYDKRALEEALPCFIDAYDELSHSSGFIYDFVELTSQVLSTSALENYYKMVQAYNSKNLADFNQYAGKFIDSIELIERVYAVSPDFSVGKWINRSRSMMSGMDDWTKDLFEFNARALISTWGGERAGDLKDYSNRMWSGLTGELYLKRWEKFVEVHRTALVNNSSPAGVNYFLLEWEWANQKSDEGFAYPVNGSGENLKTLAADIYDHYSLTSMGGNLSGGQINLAAGKTVAAKVPGTTTDIAGTGLQYLTDDNLGTEWSADSAADWPVELTVDLEESYDIEAVAFCPPQANSHALSYKIEAYNGSSWQTVVEEVNTEQVGYTGTILHNYKGEASKIRYTINKLDTMPSNYKAIFAELIVYGNMGLRNLSLNQSASQSSGGNAGSGNDGNPNTAAGDVNLGSAPANPYWWKVDLGRSYDVRKVVLDFKPGDRTDWKYKIEYSDDNSSWQTAVDYSVAAAPAFTYAQSKEFTNGVRARYFRVTLLDRPAGTGYWYVIWEFSVWGKEAEPEESLVNVAQGKTATQSGGGGAAGLGNDGNPATAAGSIDLGNAPANPYWWKVDLGRNYDIKKMALSFKPGDRTDWKYKIEYSVDNSNWQIAADYSTTAAPSGTSEQITAFADGITARYFRITLLDRPNGTTYWYVVWDFGAWAANATY